ncbi:response regulator [Spirosoma sp. SC4-14]|uniref:response regulator n=1 Tax=Spirosoma sp. SC4-14 TaxID=3128900 RepID=UPI0030D3EE38
MNTDTPIILIDGDEDDQLMLKPILQEIAPQYPILIFNDGQQAFDYLKTTTDRPFMIISEISLRLIDGLELRRQIEADQSLKKRAIPFIFFTHPVYQNLVEEAYELTIQGFFEKQSNLTSMRRQLEAIIAYWSNCLHPNRYVED